MTSTTRWFSDRSILKYDFFHAPTLQLSGWQTSTEKVLQIVGRLQAEIEEHSGDMEEVKERLEATKDTILNEQKEKTIAVEKRVASVKVGKVTRENTSQCVQ